MKCVHDAMLGGFAVAEGGFKVPSLKPVKFGADSIGLAWHKALAGCGLVQTSLSHRIKDDDGATATRASLSLPCRQSPIDNYRVPPLCKLG